MQVRMTSVLSVCAGLVPVQVTGRESWTIAAV